MTTTTRLCLFASGLLAAAGCGATPSETADASVASAPQASPAFVEKFVEVEGIKTRYLEAGQGEPLVLVHGGGFGSGVNGNRFDRNIEDFARSFRVLAVDRLGEGFTDNPTRDEDYSVEGVSRHLYEFTRALGLSRVHLLGASRGAYHVTRVALEHPEAVRTLVFANSGSIAPELEGQAAPAPSAGPEPSDPREAEYQRLKGMSYSTEHITEATMDLAMQLMALPKVKEAGLKGRGFAQGLQQQKVETLRRLQEGEISHIPILLAWGWHDASVPNERAIALLNLLVEHNPMTRMYVIGNAGHYDYREQPEEFTRVVTEFIRSHREPS